MEEQSHLENEARENRKSGRAFLVFLLIISLLGNGYLVFDYIQSAKKNKELMQLADEAGISVDSLQLELEAIQLKYNALFDESGVLSDSFKQVIDSQKLEIVSLFNKLRKRPTPQQLYEANARVKAYEMKSLQLQQLNDSLTKENKFYQDHIAAAKAEYTNTTKQLYAEYQALKSKASTVNFSVNEFDAVPVRTKRSKREKTYKAGRVDELDIAFTIVGNELIENGKKAISIRVIGTNSEVLGANNDVLMESSKLVSMTETFDYKGSSQRFHLKFKQDEAWKQGQHTVEIIHEGKVIDRIAFILE